MGHRVCPWWLGYLLISPMRRWRQSPGKILGEYVRPGMTVLEPGPGMGFFTLDLLRMVRPGGKVIAVDIQPRMIERLQKRAEKAEVADRLETHVASQQSMGLKGMASSIDFTLAFAVVHEFPDTAGFFAQVASASKPGALLLLAEPKGHVKAEDFESELQAAAASGFRLQSRPSIARSHAALLQKS